MTCKWPQNATARSILHASRYQELHHGNLESSGTWINFASPLGADSWERRATTHHLGISWGRSCGSCFWNPVLLDTWGLIPKQIGWFVAKKRMQLVLMLRMLRLCLKSLTLRRVVKPCQASNKLLPKHFGQLSFLVYRRFVRPKRQALMGKKLDPSSQHDCMVPGFPLSRRGILGHLLFESQFLFWCYSESPYHAISVAKNRYETVKPYFEGNMSRNSSYLGTTAGYLVVWAEPIWVQGAGCDVNMKLLLLNVPQFPLQKLLICCPASSYVTIFWDDGKVFKLWWGYLK